MTALRWYPVAGYAVAEEPVPARIAKDVLAVYRVRHEYSRSESTVLKCKPIPGRWVAHREPWYSCSCRLPYCAHTRAVLAYLGGPTNGEAA